MFRVLRLDNGNQGPARNSFLQLNQAALYATYTPNAIVPVPKGPSAQIVGFQGPKTIQSMDFGT